MALFYTLHDAEEWAAFSGDYNPIHFDLQHVRQQGGEQLCVHGMRAMLDMKRHLSEVLLAGTPEHDFYRFTTRMRRSVLCHMPYDLQVVDDGTALNGKLCDKASQESYFTCKLASAPPLAIASNEPEHSLAAADAIARALQFPGSAFAPAQTWVFWDALLFQLLMQSPDTLTSLSNSFPELVSGTIVDLFTQFMMVQTHHETHFSARLLSPDPHLHIEDRLSYAIQPTLVMGNRTSGFIIRTAIQARAGKKPLMMLTITLKAWPSL